MFWFFFQAEDGIRYLTVTGVQTCALPISHQGGLLPCATPSAQRHTEGRQVVLRWEPGHDLAPVPGDSVHERFLLGRGCWRPRAPVSARHYERSAACEQAQPAPPNRGEFRLPEGG